MRPAARLCPSAVPWGKRRQSSKNLTFSYGKDKQALHGLDFTVEDGEIFGFLGPNGSGKGIERGEIVQIVYGAQIGVQVGKLKQDADLLKKFLAVEVGNILPEQGNLAAVAF